MRLSRHKVAMMHDALSRMALGHLSEDMLEVAISNCLALRPIATEFRMLNEELRRRLYEGKSEEDARAMIELVIEGKAAEAESAFPALWPTFLLHNRLADKLSAKEVDVEIEQIDADTFIKAVLRDNKDISIAEVRKVFGPMLTNTKLCALDYSELDELINQ